MRIKHILVNGWIIALNLDVPTFNEQVDFTIDCIRDEIMRSKFGVKIYQLSDEGRGIRYNEWRKLGGNALSNRCPFRIRDADYMTLGEIEDVAPAEGRSFARFAVEHLHRPEFAKPWES